MANSPWAKGSDEILGQQIAGRGRMLILGTSHFVSQFAAVNYYKPYCADELHAVDYVREKIANGEISIGPPHIEPGEELILMDGGKRYGIKTTT